MMDEEKKLGYRTWLRVALVYQQEFRILAERLSGVGLSVAQFDILACLVRAEPTQLKQSELAERLLVTKGNVSGMLGRMTENGTVQRFDDPKDRRTKRIAITEVGRQLHGQGLRIQEALVDEMFEGIEPEEMRLLGSITEKISARLAVETGVGGKPD